MVELEIGILDKHHFFLSPNQLPNSIVVSYRTPMHFM